MFKLKFDVFIKLYYIVIEMLFYVQNATCNNFYVLTILFCLIVND